MMGIEGYLLLLLALAGGIILGLMYFGGLWWTIQQSGRQDQTLLLFAGSFIIRLALVIGGFYLISGGQVDRLAVALVGFIIARQIWIKRAAPETKGDKDHHGNKP